MKNPTLKQTLNMIYGIQRIQMAADNAKNILKQNNYSLRGSFFTDKYIFCAYNFGYWGATCFDVDKIYKINSPVL